MLSILFRIVFSPLFWLFLRWIRFVDWLTLRDAGVLEIQLDANKRQKHPLWTRELEHAAAHKRIRLVHLKVESGKWGWAELQTIRDTVSRISASGTPVIASLESGDTPGLYLASACDSVYLAPLGGAFLGGIGIQMQFFGDAMERVGLKFEVISAGDYKSAAEPISRAFPSRPNREALTALVEDLHAQLKEAISQGRGIDMDRLQDIMDGGVLSSAQALEVGLVDELVYPKVLEERIEARLGKKAREVGEQKFFKRLRWTKRWKTMFRKRPRLQVLHLEGAIVRDAPKWSRKSQISQEESLDVLEALIERPPEAVVLFVDSPGGSALVSDLLWEAVVRLNEKTPVVACFSNVSASGGYYLSAGCRQIVAQPMTLTGSIGVISGKVVTGAALARLGVFSERIAGAEGAALLGTDRPLSEEHRRLLRLQVKEIYREFKDRVEQGRSMSAEEVEAVAQGRVWTGRQAEERTLVDAMGGLPEALRRAAELGEFELEGARLGCKKVQKAKPLWSRFMTQGPSGIRALVAGAISTQTEVFLQHPAEPLALWPVELDLD